MDRVAFLSERGGVMKDYLEFSRNSFIRLIRDSTATGTIISVTIICTELPGQNPTEVRLRRKSEVKSVPVFLSFQNYFVPQLERWVLSILFCGLFFFFKKASRRETRCFLQHLLPLQNWPCHFCSTNKQNEVALPLQHIRKLLTDSEDLYTLYCGNAILSSAPEAVRKMIVSPCSFCDFWPLLCFSFHFAILPITTRNPTD